VRSLISVVGFAVACATLGLGAPGASENSKGSGAKVGPALPKPAPGPSPSGSAPAKPKPQPSGSSRPVPIPKPGPSARPLPGPSAAQSAAKPSNPAPAPKTEPARDACPSGMQLVDGDYCSKVEHTCLKSWFDTSNKKTVCEEFEPVSKCIGERTHKRYCIDRYTWPNEKGARPEVMNRFHQAQLKCAAVGKRLCTESEWTLACEGPKMLPFPYGYTRDTKKCHGDMLWDSPDMKKVAARDPDELARLWKGKRNGSQPQCVSDYGVADLPGNVDEVVSNETNDGSFRAKFDSVHSGGPWYKGVRNQCRPKIYTHDEGFYYYFLGFRCCSEPDGKSTDPRTPRQIKEGWKLPRIERSAGFTLEEMKKKLELKKSGQCQCQDKDILCKTMCGTLLAPSARDYSEP
jgi:sulfatase modifying factor 1